MCRTGHQHPAAPSALAGPVPSPSQCGTRHHPLPDGPLRGAARCQHIRGAPRSSASRNQRHGTLGPCPQLCPACCWSGWGRAQPSAAPGVGLELWTGLRGGAELPEAGQARPAQPPGLAQWRFIWNEWFPNKLCNLKILRKRKRQKGGEPTAAQPVHGDCRATRHPGLSPGTGRGSATAAPSPWLWPPAPEATWPHRPLSVSGGQATLVPSVTSPRAVSSVSCL